MGLETRRQFGFLVSEVLHLAKLDLRYDSTLFPFLEIEFEGKKEKLVFELESGADAVSKARKYIFENSSKIQIYALAYNAMLVEGETKGEVIVIEGGEKGANYGHQLMQRYQPNSGTAEFKAIGNLFNHRAIDNYLKKLPEKPSTSDIIFINSEIPVFGEDFKQWPLSLEEAADEVIRHMDDDTKKRIAKLPKSDLPMLHFLMGTDIRNNLGLWKYVPDKETLQKEGIKAFLDNDPDRVSGEIIKMVWERLQ